MSLRTCVAPLAVLLVAAVPALGQEVVRVGIDKNRFEPKDVRVKPGTVVEWVNQEKRTNHSILFEGVGESDRLFPGDTFRKSFPKPGRYEYRCGPHPDMVGVVEVVP